MLLGPQGGKTTKLREVARVLSDEFQKGSSLSIPQNEIAGDGDIPHPAIGRASSNASTITERQHDVMISRGNHMPEVIIDEIGREEEAGPVEPLLKGVQLIATAHGNSLRNLY